jgi:hypothetical protein
MILAQYQKIGAVEGNIGQYAGIITRGELDDLLVDAFSHNFAVLIERLKNIQNSNIKPEEVLKLILERLTDIVKCKILEKSDNSHLFELAKDLPVLKACDIVYDALKNISPLTPDNLLLQITVYKLAAIPKKK